jgi:hypothetical protein
MRMDAAAVDARPVPPGTSLAATALLLLLGGLALFFIGCHLVFPIDPVPECPTGQVLVGDMCANGYPNHYGCACDCTGFGIGATIAVSNPSGTPLNVREPEGGAIIGTVNNLDEGLIVDGPRQAVLDGVDETWWRVQFTNVTGWVVQKFITVVQPVSILVKDLDVCLPPGLDQNNDGTAPAVTDLVTDCTDRVQPAFMEIFTGQPLPPQTTCQCSLSTNAALPFTSDCSAECSSPSGVCVVAGSDPEQPTPDPVSAAVLAPTSVCEVTGTAEIHVGDDVVNTNLKGRVQIHGRPCLPGQPCAVGLSYQIDLDPITFAVRFASDPRFVDLGIIGATEPAAVNLGVLGGIHVGQIPTGASVNTLRGRRSTSASNIVMVARNGAALGVAIDWTSRQCLIDGLFVSTEGGGVVDGETTQPLKVLMTVGGPFGASRIVNQPPRPNATATPQTVECTSPQGAAVTLNATLSTDPDSNIAFFIWRRDSETGPLVTDPVFTPTITTQQPLGEKTYHLRVVDKRFAADSTVAKVKVIDSTPPVVQCEAPPLIPKKDTPISFTATTQDVCGTAGVVVERFECYKIAPEGRIIDNPSCKGSINGGTLTIGNSAGADLIRWFLASTDASGNVTRKTCEVSVSP